MWLEKKHKAHHVFYWLKSDIQVHVQKKSSFFAAHSNKSEDVKIYKY